MYIIYDAKSNERFKTSHFDIVATIFICLYNYMAADIYLGRHRRNSAQPQEWPRARVRVNGRPRVNDVVKEKQVDVVKEKQVAVGDSIPTVAVTRCVKWGAVAEWVRALDWRPDGPGFESHCGKLFASELWQFRLPRFAGPVSFGGDTNFRRVGPFYLVSMPGEVKDPTSPHWNV